MAIIVLDKQHVWLVGASIPKDESKGRRWARTTTVIVVAPTAERAIESAREHWGPCDVYSVQHYASAERDIILSNEAQVSVEFLQGKD